MPFRIVPRRDRKLNRLAKAGELLEIRRGAVLYAPGDHVRDVYLVREGHVRLWQPTSDDQRPRTVAVAGPREVFGVEAVFAGPGVRRRYGASAGEATKLVVLPGDGVARAFRTGERTFIYAFRAAHEDLAMARWFGAGRGGPTTAERLADVLLDLAQRFGLEEGTGLRIQSRFTHQELADLAGAHRSTITTLVNDWIYRRILKDGPEGLLVRPHRLEKRASGYGRKGDSTTAAGAKTPRNR